MNLIKERKCPECGGEMDAKLINLHYKREGVDLEVEVIGIPANVCTRCFYRIIPGKVAKYLDSLVDPIFESEINRKEKILPSPHVGIQFPSLDRNAYGGL
jgi:YgiT-type zinc finger domain-containing protein